MMEKNRILMMCIKLIDFEWVIDVQLFYHFICNWLCRLASNINVFHFIYFWNVQVLNVDRVLREMINKFYSMTDSPFGQNNEYSVLKNGRNKKNVALMWMRIFCSHQVRKLPQVKLQKKLTNDHAKQNRLLFFALQFEKERKRKKNIIDEPVNVSFKP